jgi:leucyl-tRNA synthetase
LSFDAVQEIISELDYKDAGRSVTKFRMRDAIFARQRYWGEPIPLVYKKDGTIETLPENELPLVLPDLADFAPAGNGQSPLAKSAQWIEKGYETNTMPGWAGSSWYFLRYMDPHNNNVFASKEAIDYWQDVDMYVGGAEHATGHLLYSRFWHKALFDLGFVTKPEPFKALRNQGMIGGTDGRKMSKRWGNVINPDDVVAQMGADTLRVYESFMGPFESHLPWSTDGIVGSRRFVERVYRFAMSKVNENETPTEALKQLHKTIKKVRSDIDSFSFNTAIASMMICLNEFEKVESVNKNDFALYLQILAPFAPFITEELWNKLGFEGSIHTSAWPNYIEALTIDDEITIGIQINGKVRGDILVGIDEDEELVKEKALSHENVMKWLEGKEPKKVIYVKGRIVSIVI